ncbi:MAG: 2,3,4,5-tetrahydropyridine-2,6-dicarboxylate N-succinyltransferase [Proteobacteria bacterium]|nr:2,3,4,5-tetrahydropyridine-2,6-dicarboxylate N-succinyltransferase [Pseudomonadota bacterium]
MTLESFIHQAWQQRDIPTLKPHLEEVLTLLDEGKIRVAEKKDNQWIVHEWLKKAILLAFNVFPSLKKGYSYDKIPLKWENWDEERFKKARFRSVPGAIARFGSYIAENVVLMPSFINIGAYVDTGTMIDTWATIGSCAQIGKNCHISGGVGIGGVLEPLQARPVIIEDNCFIGARSEIAEGVMIGEGAVLSMGVFISASTKIIDRQTKEIFYKKVPAYSVVIPGTLPGKTPLDPSLACAVIVKRVDEKTRSKTSINELLRA